MVDAVNLANMLSPQVKGRSPLSESLNRERISKQPDETRRPVKEIRDPAPRKEAPDTSRSRKVEFEEVLEAEITLREALRKLEADTDQRPGDINVNFDTSILAGGENLDQGLSFMPTLAEFDAVMTDIQETVEVADPEASISNSETPSHGEKEGATLLESETTAQAAIRDAKGSETLSGSESNDPLNRKGIKDAQDKKDAKTASEEAKAATKDSNKKASEALQQASGDDSKKAEEMVKLAKEMGGAQNVESEKLAKQLKLSESAGDVKVKVTNVQNAQQADLKALTQAGEEKLINLQEIEAADQLASKEDASRADLLKKADVTSQKAEAIKGEASQKGTVTPPEFTQSLLKPSVLSEATNVQGQVQNLQAGFKAEGAQVPVYTSSQQTAMVTQVSQGMLAAKQEGLTKFFIQMNPPQLGKVLVDIQIKGGQVKALFSANKETLSLLKEDSDVLRDSLKEMGIEGDAEFEFSLLGDEGGQGSRFDGSPPLSSSGFYTASREEIADPVVDLRSLHRDQTQIFHEVA